MGTLTDLPVCLCCGSAMTHIIDFGPTRLANTYGVEDKFPLALKLCSQCRHLQLAQSVDPAILFKDYCYCSGTSRTAREFFEWFAAVAISASSGVASVLDIASNDGTQLDYFREYGLDTHGCDPAINLCEQAEQKGHKVFRGMFEDMPITRTFDLITAQNVLAHTPYPISFLSFARKMMHQRSRLMVVTSQADMIVKNECDTIYHEHISYFNTHSMRCLADAADLTLLDVDTHPMHGTSYIFTFARRDAQQEPFPSVESRIAIEELRGLFEEDTYWAWALAAKRSVARFRKTIQWHKDNGYVTAGLGAAAKGISMLNMAGITLDHLYDTTPLKQGKTASGMLIEPFEKIAHLHRDERMMFAILAWNFEAEVRENVALQRQSPYDVFITNK